MTSTLPPLVQAVAGAVGSASANTLTYPLDLVTTRVQLSSPADTGLNANVQRSGKGKQKEREQENALDLKSPHVFTKRLETSTRFQAVRILRSIIQSDGVRALYDGLMTDTATVWQDLALGFMSGVASRAVSMPLSIITLRLQTGRHEDSYESGMVNQEPEARGNAVIQTVKKIYEEQGFSGFWRAVALLYPLILSKTRLQASRSRSTNSFGSPKSQSTSRPKTLGAVMLDAYYGRYHHGTSSIRSTSDKQVRGASGINGLYQGLEMQILKGFLNQGVTFLVKGR
ncbi:hypothetical protein HHX47_DHR3000601 [Lentinula edodes]|nr:hypothetical protein HHX47_DHR3000601 [Lentinula edodes]